VAESQGNIHTAIIQVMGKVGYVQKQKKGSLKYSYAGEAALIAALRPAMLEHNITLYAKYPTVEFGEFITSNDKRMNSARVHGEFTFTHAPSQTSVTVQSIGEGMDVGDKAIYKAMTGSFKYALRQTFIIETGDDPDATSSTDYAKKPKKKAREENQWEDNVIAAIMELGLAQAKPHAIHRLNNSLFMDRPFGELGVQEGVAYCMAWEDATKKYPEDSTEQRAGKVNANWLKYVSRAVKKLEGK